MLAATIIARKRDNLALTDQEIEFLIEGYSSGDVADYQMSALAMAICLRGMNQRETTSLTRAMLASGERWPRQSDSDRPRVDKHSTGGLGDKVSLVLAPLLAACGAEVPMISGRGLGMTGGTLDKLEAIKGFQTQLGIEQSTRVLRDVGACIVGASDAIAPADRKLYALRDVTGTVESIPLITASILSKKLAENLDALIMDVKVGGGAFMKTLGQAAELAESIISVGKQTGLPAQALISDMEQPLGSAIGNAIEVNEAIEVMQGGGPQDVRELVIELGATLLVQVKLADSMAQATKTLGEQLDQGHAWDRFERLVRAQGGDGKYPLQVVPGRVICSPSTGNVASIDCQAIGQAIVQMGGGRRQTGDRIDPRVGISMHVRIGDPVDKGQPVMTVHAAGPADEPCISNLAGAIKITAGPVATGPLIVQRLW